VTDGWTDGWTDVRTTDTATATPTQHVHTSKVEQSKPHNIVHCRWNVMK